MKPEFSLYKAVFADVLEFHCCRGKREVGGWAREPDGLLRARQRRSQTCKKTLHSPGPARFTREEKSMAIDLQYKGTAALAGGCHLTGAVQGTRRGSPRWGLR